MGFSLFFTLKHQGRDALNQKSQRRRISLILKGNPLSRDRIFRAENCHFTSRTVTILFQSPDGAIWLTNRGPNLKSFLQGAIQNCEVLKRFHIPNC